MLIKKSSVEIIDVVSDMEHNIDDEGTRKALAQAKEKVATSSTIKKSESKEDAKVEN